MINFGVLDTWLARRFGEGFLRRSILDTTFTPILLGVLLAHLLHSPRGYAVFARGFGSRWSPVVVFAALVALIELGPSDISGLPRLVIQLTMTLLLCTLVVREDHAAQPLLTFGPIARLGVISYGLYLYHLWTIHIVRESFERLRLEDKLAFFAASVALTAVVAEVSFRLIESPLLRLKRHFGGG
jgi:peptidoglycan/LPS O-acetylase OafA/YrhL